jgi:hypothetical protein
VLGGDAIGFWFMGSDSVVGVIDPGLWERVSAAFPAVNAAIDRHVKQGGWVPRASIPVMERFEGSGWPRVLFPVMPGDKAPPDYSRLFGLTAGDFTPYGYRDIPELAAVIDYVTGRADLVTKLDVIPEPAQVAAEVDMWFVTLQAAGLVLSVVARARALGHPYDPETLLALYRERERSLLANELEADLVAPLVLTRLDLEEPLDLGGGARLEKLSEEIQLARARDSYPVEAVAPPVSGAATHAVVITGVKVDNSSLAARLWRGSWGKLPFEKLDLAVECLRVVTHAPTGYAQVFLRPVGWADHWTHALPPVVDVGVFHRYPASFDRFHWLRENPVPVTAAELATLPVVVRSVSKASSTKEGKVALLALRRLSLAGLRDDSDDTMVDACIGIEALLSENSTDLTYKIAVRGAAVIGARPEKAFSPQEAFTMLKHVYARRSDLVHGTMNEKKKFFRVGDQEIRTSTLAVLLLRELLFSQLTGDPAWTINDLDEKLLTSLIQDTPAQPAGPAADSTAGTPDEGK